MFWILRRTGAANFFNSINNNYASKSSSSGTNSGITSEKNNPRPPRKAYGRLSMEADDNNCSLRCHEINANGPLIDFLDNGNSCQCGKKQQQQGHKQKSSPQMGDEPSQNDSNLHFCHCKDSNENNVVCNGGGGDGDERHQGDGDEDEADSDLELADRINRNIIRNRRFNDNGTISRIQAMAMSDDDDDYDESLTCNVCDRAFNCHRQLASHQQKKRHFGCSGCDSLFPSLMLLEHHKEEFEHWSDLEEDSRRLSCCRRSRRDEFSDSESGTSDAESEDLERLL